MVSQYNFPTFYFMERETSLVALAKSQSAVLYIVKDKNATKATFQTGYWVREHTRVWDFPNKLKRASGYSFAVLAPYSKQEKDGKGMERKRETEHYDLLPQRGNPLNETVCYKIGGTVFEIETSCGGCELLYDKMTRLIKAETVKTPADKEMRERYNSDSNLFVGRSLQEE